MNITATARTNAFLVKDNGKFAEAVSRYDVNAIMFPDGRVALLSEGDCGVWPWSFYDEEADEDRDIDWGAVFSEHLQEGCFAVVIEVSNVGMRSVHGVAHAYRAGNPFPVQVIDLVQDVCNALKGLDPASAPSRDTFFE